MIDHSLLADLLSTFTIGLVFVVALARLRVPSLVALMLAGIVTGPSGLGIIDSPARVDALAEIGIVLLLFTVGLDFSLGTVKQVWRRTLAGGSMQIVGTAAVVASALIFMDVAPRLAIFIGLFVALSSTAIVLNGLAARNELASPHGRLMTGVLLLQDLAIVALLLLVPILSGQTPLTAAPPAVAKALLAIAVVALASRYGLPLILRIVTTSGRREAFPLAILVASVGTAWASTLLGLSMAVGAFLAGLMLAESEYSHQAYAEIRGVRDVLAALFFISLGMLVDLGAASQYLPTIVGVAADVYALLREHRVAAVLHPNIWQVHGAWQVRAWAWADSLDPRRDGTWPRLRMGADGEYREDDPAGQAANLLHLGHVRGHRLMNERCLRTGKAGGHVPHLG